MVATAGSWTRDPGFDSFFLESLRVFLNFLVLVHLEANQHIAWGKDNLYRGGETTSGLTLASRDFLTFLSQTTIVIILAINIPGSPAYV